MIIADAAFEQHLKWLARIASDLEWNDLSAIAEGDTQLYNTIKNATAKSIALEIIRLRTVHDPSLLTLHASNGHRRQTSLENLLDTKVEIGRLYTVTICATGKTLCFIPLISGEFSIFTEQALIGHFQDMRSVCQTLLLSIDPIDYSGASSLYVGSGEAEREQTIRMSGLVSKSEGGNW